MFKPENKLSTDADIFSGEKYRKEKDSIYTTDEMVEGCLNKDPAVMEEVFQKYKTSLFNISYRYTGNTANAEDLTQEIFIKIFQNIRKLRKTGAFEGWLYRIAVNTCLNFIRSSRLKKEKLNQHQHNIELKPVKNGNELLKIQIEQALHRLPLKQKSVFILHDVEGFTHNEIAEMMRWSEGTSKSQLFKARIKMRGYLKD